MARLFNLKSIYVVQLISIYDDFINKLSFVLIEFSIWDNQNFIVL